MKILSGDLCGCGAYDYDNGSVVCWVCEEIVVPWVGSITTATLPGHDALRGVVCPHYAPTKDRSGRDDA